MMTRMMGKYLLVLLLLLPTTLLFVGQSKISRNIAFADDSMEGEDEEAIVETDEGPAEEEVGEDTDTGVTDQEQEEESEEEEPALKASPDAATFILFTKPSGSGQELPAGKTVRFLVGFTNKGYGEFTVESMDASLRYPQDYSYYIQNYTTLTLNRVVESKRQATFEYSFVPSESFSSRPFGLTVNVNYKDGQDNQFQSAVFNDTIQVVESEEGLDGETFFMYVFLAALALLLLVGAQQLVSSMGRKRMSKPRPAVEMGTQNADIDYDWIPKETIKEMNRSPGRSPKQSPRQRRSKRSSGSAEE
ncbi:translocon-associated protein subunit alpha-like [Babylonia areolata]|uniref:translocon-associated protein subunit alpha-like n=1 Tax=Babylonia areolata TaxID=304850 RepID=UPI003FD533E7